MFTVRKKINVVFKIVVVFLFLFEVKNNAQQTVLVFSPHPDDDILGCGGSIAKYIKNGNNVSVVFMTSGERGNNKGKYNKNELAFLRENEAQNAQKILGCNDLIFLRNPDGNLQLNNSTHNQVKQIIESKWPTIIYIPHKMDNHKDHKMTHTIVVNVLKTLQKEIGPKKFTKPKILCYEVWTPLQNVTHVEDISQFMEIKLDALKEHVTQVEHIDFVDAFRGLNRYRGALSHKGIYCECFLKLDF